MFKITDELYLARFDKLNLAIVKGAEPRDEKKGFANRVVSYHGSVQDAFKSALNTQIKMGADGVQAKVILDAIDLLHKRIDAINLPSLREIMKGEKDEK